MIRPIVRAYDEWQDWLTVRWVCGRQSGHKQFFEFTSRSLPTRAEGEQISWDDRPVLVVWAAGIAAWVLPNVALIDAYGLNDWLVARNPIGTPTERQARQREFLRSVFALVDFDNDQLISRDEIAAALPMAEPDLKNRPVEIQNRTMMYLDSYARNLDGFVSMEELNRAEEGTGERRMAHDRFPPPGYLENVRPNVVLVDGSYVVIKREEPLTDEDIREHEARFRALFGGKN